MVQILLKHMWTQWYTEFWMIFLGIFCSFLYAAQRKRTTWKKGPKDGFWHSLNMFWFHVTRMYLENLGVSRVSVHLKTRLPLWCLLDGDLQLRCQCSQAFKTRNLPRYCWDCFFHTIRNKKKSKNMAPTGQFDPTWQSDSSIGLATSCGLFSLAPCSKTL